MDTTGRCLCHAGTYMRNGICEPCIPNCASCSNGVSCDTCDTTSLKTVVASLDTCQCSSGYIADATNGECVLSPTFTNCPAGQYLSNNTCQDCHIDCASCVGPSKDECVICTDKTKHVAEKLNNTGAGKCVCRNGFFENSDKTCEACHSSCAGLSCVGTEWDDCRDCLKGASYVAGQGCRECEEGYSYNTFVEMCIPKTTCNDNFYADSLGECQ